MFGFQQCFDAYDYVRYGKNCSNDWSSCWNEIRPIGAVILNALMPFGLEPFNHLLLLFFSFFLIFTEFHQKNNKFSTTLMLKVGSLFVLFEFMFIGLASVNLTDVSAGVFAAVAILGFFRKNASLLALRVD